MWNIFKIKADVDALRKLTNTTLDKCYEIVGEDTLHNQTGLGAVPVAAILEGLSQLANWKEPNSSSDAFQKAALEYLGQTTAVDNYRSAYRSDLRRLGAPNWLPKNLTDTIALTVFQKNDDEAVGKSFLLATLFCKVISVLEKRYRLI